MCNVSIIMAADINGGFGFEGKIPWHYSEDFAFFKRMTLGKSCVMGRKTYEEINEIMGERGKDSVLPGRKCYVLTRNSGHSLQNAIAVNSMKSIEEDDFFVIGGKALYNEALTFAKRIYLTTINKEFECDVHVNLRYIKEMFHVTETFLAETPELTFQLLERNK